MTLADRIYQYQVNQGKFDERDPTPPKERYRTTYRGAYRPPGPGIGPRPMPEGEEGNNFRTPEAQRAEIFIDGEITFADLDGIAYDAAPEVVQGLSEAPQLQGYLQFPWRRTTTPQHCRPGTLVRAAKPRQMTPQDVFESTPSDFN
eukprot:GEMP01086362.1.p1 GENE.GEMP01086362.1~~GEMP01086362.1.p1  ORF type:complete len:157 (+),score=16.01 GEMP01086362.1:36-473(+)